MADGVVFFPSYYEAIQNLPDQDRLAVYDAVVRYGLYGEIIELAPQVNSLFILMRPTIDSSQARHRAAKENGRRGGRPKKNQSEKQRQKQSVSQTAESDADFNEDGDFESMRQSSIQKLLEAYPSLGESDQPDEGYWAALLEADGDE